MLILNKMTITSGILVQDVTWIQDTATENETH